MLNFSNKKIWILCLLASFFSCNDEMNKVPEKLIDPDKMAKVITELQFTEAKVSRLGLISYDSSKVAYDFLENKIFEKMGIDSTSYWLSYDYYATDGEKMIEILEKVKATVEKMEEEEKSKAK